jgi:nicotinamide riboside kinase
VDVTDEHVWAAQVASIRAAMRPATDLRVDAVFSCEAYGWDLARRFDAEHVRLERSSTDTSGTAIRADLAAGWTNLEPATRAGLATRIVVVGAESTGTTTIAAALADHYAARGGSWSTTRCVPEYGRAYTGQKWTLKRESCGRAGRPDVALADLVWDTDDFDAVAAEQTRTEELAARLGSPVLLCDTDAFATSIWERRYLAAAARTDQPWSVAPQLPRRDLYLITDHHDVPWYDDGIREGDLDVRAQMTGWFVDALTRSGHSWVLLTGSLEQRLSLAVRTIDQLLAIRMSFAAPLAGPGFEPASR